ERICQRSRIGFRYEAAGDAVLYHVFVIAHACCNDWFAARHRLEHDDGHRFPKRRLNEDIAGRQCSLGRLSDPAEKVDTILNAELLRKLFQLRAQVSVAYDEKLERRTVVLQ